MKLIYVTVFEGSDRNSTGIYETQVLQFIEEVNQHIECKVIGIIPKIGKEVYHNLCLKYNVETESVLVNTKFEIHKRKIKKQFNEIVKNFLKDDTGYILCREVISSAFVHKCNKSYNIITDKRGIPSIESFTFKTNIFHKLFRYFYFSYFEFYTFRNCNNFRFVSNAMADYFLKKYSITDCSYIVQPTGVKMNHLNLQSLSRKWDFKEEYNIIYSGGRGSYHCFDDILEFMVRINKQNLNANLIVCSYFNNEEEQYYINKYPFIKFYNRLTQQELQKILSLGHYGLCLRKNSIINRISAPTKISEYLGYNMKVIYSGTIGSIEDLKCVSSSTFITSNRFQIKTDRTNEQYDHFKDIISFENQANNIVNYLNNLNE